MGVSTDYLNVPDWVAKSDGYRTGAMVKYQGNIFYANFWASEPGVGDAVHNGWRFYDELYDQTPHMPIDQAKVIAYIPTWRKAEGFNYANDEMYRYITHCIIAFLEFDEINLSEFTPRSLHAVNDVISDVVNTGHRNGTRISIALGGATDYGFLNLMTSIGNNPAAPILDQAVKNVAQFVTSNNLDGVDLDLECWWGKPGENDQGGRKKSEGPHPAGSALTLFAQKLKQAMPDKLVSAAVFGTSWYGNNYDPTIADHVDWLGVMTYDLTGSWNESPVGPHTALFKIRNQESSNVRVQESYQESYLEEQQGEWPGGRGGRGGIVDNFILSVEDALWYWTNPLFVNWQGAGQKIPRNKIAAGVPIFGYDFAYGKEPESGHIAPGYKVIRYKDLLARYPDAHTIANVNIKESGSTPRPPFIAASGDYPYANNIYFETPDTAVAKLNFVKSVGAQGVIIWELSNDVWEDGRSIIKEIYRNSGNPAIRPPLPSLLEPLVPFELIGVFTGKLSVSEKLSVSLRPFVSPGMPNAETTIGTSGPPALAVYQGKLFCVHEGRGRDGWLWYCTVEPAFRSSITAVPQVKKWSEDTKLGFGTSGPPALAVYDGTLFCVHPGRREDGWLWCCTFDGTKWSEDTKLNVGVRAGRHNVPCAALAVYEDKLFCVHEGQDGFLWCCTFDGKKWSEDSLVRRGKWPFHLGPHTFGSGDRPAIGTSGAPALAVLNNKLLCFHEQSGETGWMWHCAFDGKEWSEDQQFYSTIKNPWFINKAASGVLQGVGTSGPPSASVHNSRLYLLHQGRGQDGHLHSINASAGHEDRDLSIPMSGSPASAAYQNVLYTVYEGSGQDGSLYVSTTSLTESPIPTASPRGFNLRMGEHGRPSTPYNELSRYNLSLNETGPNPALYPVQLSRHHIIPYPQLRDFWNMLADQGRLRNSTAPLFSAMTDFLNSFLRERGDIQDNIHDQDLRDVIQLLVDIRTGAVVHNPGSPTPNGWDLLQQVYVWCPGNLFIGPRGVQRTDDPGEGFDVNAGAVVRNLNPWQRANASIAGYLNGGSSAHEAVRQLSAVVSGEAAPVALNASNWVFVDHNGEGGTPRYRLRTPHDEL